MMGTTTGTIVQDVRFAMRSLLKRPAFTIVAILSLALGIGANTAIFSVIDAVLLRPLPYADPSQLVDVYNSSEQMSHGKVSAPTLRDWREQNHVFSQLAAYRSGNVNLEGVSTPERLSEGLTSANIFSLLGATSELGRTFRDGEDAQGAPRVVVLSDGLWRRHFASNPAIVGKSIRLSGEAYTVIGVMPGDFRFPATESTDVWTPLQLTADAAAHRDWQWLAVIGRIKQGVDMHAAGAEMQQISARLAERYPAERSRSVLVVPLRQDLAGDVQPALFVLLGAAGLVLLIACANVANLLLARASDRRREVAIRVALGAGRARLIRQFLTESLLLALLGGAASILLAYIAVRPLVRAAGDAIPFGTDVGFDPRLLGFMLALSVLTGLVFGVAPAIQAASSDLQSDLKEGGDRGSAGHKRQRFRAALVISEIALALVLLAGAGLLMRAFLRLESTDSGMVTRNVLTMHLSVPPQKYDSTVSARFYQPVLERVGAIPGVRAVGLTTLLPLQASHNYAPVVIEGRAPDKPGNTPIAEDRVVSPGYFNALGIRVLRGRDFLTEDGRTAAPEVVINHAFASKYFPGSDPVGRRIRLSKSVSAPIVGVVSDVRETQLDQLPAPTSYLSFQQYQQNNMVLVVSTTVPPQAITAAVRRAIHSVDPDQPVYEVQTMNEVVSKSISNRRFSFWLLGGFAVIALLLAATGIYGVMSYMVTQRTREIGIRMALGAREAAVLRLIMRYGMILVVAGVAIGTVFALALTRMLASMFYDVGGTNPTTFVSVALLLGTTALIASYLPARRAAKVDPVITLRSE